MIQRSIQVQVILHPSSLILRNIAGDPEDDDEDEEDEKKQSDDDDDEEDDEDEEETWQVVAQRPRQGVPGEAS